MSGFDDFNDHLNGIGGKWVKLSQVGDTLRGELVEIEKRDKTFEGKLVLSRKTNKPRTEFVITIKVTPEGADDDGLRKFAADESAQRALKDARPADGFRAGGRIAIQCTAPKPSPTDQATYVAEYAAPVAAPVAAGNLL